MAQKLDLERVEALVQPALQGEAVELVDLRFVQEGGRWVLRFYLDKAGGISLDDCERLSGRIGAVLDMEDAVPGSYSLEVSSPGLDRVLKREADFARFAGHRVKVRLREGLDGQRNFRGTLKGASGGTVSIDFGGRELSFPLSDVAEARLDPEIRI